MLEQQEFERRVELAERSQTIEELDALVADFGAQAALPAVSARHHIVVLSNQEYQLRPEQDREFNGVAVLGNIDVDLRAFRGSGLTVVVKVSGYLSETRIRVPRGTRLVRDSHIILGEVKTSSAGQPGTLRKLWNQLVGTIDSAPVSPYPAGGPPPTVILQGLLVLGNITVREDAN